jgi:hypothetical protein
MKRKSSYQKLKEENARLRGDIYKMVRGTFEEQYVTKKSYLFEYKLKDVCLAGDVTELDTELNGILRVMNTNK